MSAEYTKYKRYAKLSDGTYKLISHWTSSNTVEFDDGNTAQTKLGAISGITDSLTADSPNVALSAAGGKNLQTQISELNSNLNYSIQVVENNYINNIGLRITERAGVVYSDILFSTQVAIPEWTRVDIGKITGWNLGAMGLALVASLWGSDSAALLVRIDETGNIYIATQAAVTTTTWFYGTGTFVI